MIHSIVRSRHSPEIPPILEERLIQFVRNETGILVQNHQREGLRRFIRETSARAGYRSYARLLDELLKQHASIEFFNELVDTITVSESYFFRDEAQISYLKNTFLPRLVAEKRKHGPKVLRVWSAGCAKGQEIHTIGILLRELLPDIEDWKIRLIGTDISTGRLQGARNGQYTNWDLRRMDSATRRKYFVETGGRYELIADVRNMARFFALNLVSDPFPTIFHETNEQDLILCRNVFIYFDREVSDTVLHKLTKSLRVGGILLLGAAEAISWALPNELTIEVAGAHCYRRRTPLADRSSAAEGGAGRDSAIARTSNTTRAAFAGDRRPPAAAKKDAEESPYEDIAQRLRRSEWLEALGTIDGHIARDGETGALLILKAKALANLGRFAEAVMACEHALVESPTDEEGYFVYGMALLGLGETEGAEKAFRRAIFLNPLFLEAHYQVALTLLSTNRVADGLKSLRNALRIADDGDPNREIHDAPGMTFRRFADLVRAEFEIYSASYGR